MVFFNVKRNLENTYALSDANTTVQILVEMAIMKVLVNQIG